MKARTVWIFTTVASAIFAVFAAACARVFFIAERSEIIGFAANIAGGFLGGVMTLAAAVLAWTASRGQIDGLQEQIRLQQQQIELQRQELALAKDEHRKRLIKLLIEIDDVLLGVQHTLRKSHEEKGAGRPMPEIPDLSGILETDDLWRASATLPSDLRKLEADISKWNAHHRSPRSDGYSIHITFLTMIAKSTADLRISIRADLDKLGHTATQQPEDIYIGDCLAPFGDCAPAGN